MKLAVFEIVKKALIDIQYLPRVPVKDTVAIAIPESGKIEDITAAVESIKKYFGSKVYVLTGVLKDKDYEAIGEWARFYKQYQKRDYILAEDFSYKDGNWCFGSRCSVENSAWFCMMLHRLRRELQ